MKADTSTAVDEFMRGLVHPFRAEVQAIRAAILDASPLISEGIKWKSPSFRTSEYFATVNLREKAGVGVILHLGAKVRELGPEGLVVDDPTGLAKWLAKDRARVLFANGSDFAAKKTAFQSLIRSWIEHV